MILAGDIGGTNTRLAAFEIGAAKLTARGLRDYLNREYDGIEDIIDDYLKNTGGKFRSAALAVAGPVVHNAVTGTNLQWPVHAASIRARHPVGNVVLLNDLLALAYGLTELGADDIEVLQAGVEDGEGNFAVIAAGTGLGESGLLRRGGQLTPFPTEGGHCDFAPNNPLETELYEFLRQRFGHVSYERVLSGQGIENVYEFLRDTGKHPEPKELKAELESCADRAAVIGKYALSGEHEICVRSLEIFADVLGAETGNLVMRLFAIGGVYLGGGIAPKVAAFLRRPAFLDALRAKGRMRPLVENTPIKLITNQYTGLIGAAAFARDQLKLSPTETQEVKA